MLIVAYTDVVVILDLGQELLIRHLKLRRDTAQAKDEIAVGRRYELGIPLTAHDTRQLVPAFHFRDLEATSSI